MLDDLDKKIIALIQGDLPLSAQPYAELAQTIGIAEDILLERIRRLKADGIIRRFGAILRHQKAGINANVMIVWQVPEEKIEETGAIMAQYKEVSHCYQRVIDPDWPYNLYTMVHGHDEETCCQIAQKIALATGIKDYLLLFSEKEFKKTSMRFF
ncbi:MAG: Lrp/AsnC family transcriptional regulator [Desulfobacteraceae bacterium]|nr:MAG: Lrp/AsnC family transcriptional regulator [Desulfobacteraceae bacterium]